jgi:hypothetical protein
MRSVLGRVFLVFALLLAQQAAFAHQVWHAAGEADKSTQNSQLCDQHAGLGTVLGALNGCHAIALLAETAPVHFPTAHSPVDRSPGLPPASRGPPSVS